MRSLQLVGPVWGHTWVPGCMTENLIWKQKQPHRDRRRTRREAGQERSTNLSSLTACRFGESLQQRARLRDALTGSGQFFS